MNPDLVKWFVFITAKQQQKPKPQGIARAAVCISVASCHGMESVCVLQVLQAAETQFDQVWRQSFLWFSVLYCLSKSPNCEGIQHDFMSQNNSKAQEGECTVLRGSYFCRSNASKLPCVSSKCQRVLVPVCCRLKGKCIIMLNVSLLNNSSKWFSFRYDACQLY